MNKRNKRRFLGLWALAFASVGASGGNVRRHQPSVVCTDLWLRVRSWGLKSRMTPKLNDWIDRTKVPNETFLKSTVPLNSETYLAQVLWVMDNFTIMPHQVESGKRTQQVVERPTEGQAFRLAYACLARGFRVDFLQQRLAEYRYRQYPIETMDDFISHFIDDVSVGGRKLSGGETFGLYGGERQAQ